MQCTNCFKAHISLTQYISNRFGEMSEPNRKDEREAISKSYWLDIQRNLETNFVTGVKVGKQYGVNYRRLTLIEYLLLVEDMYKQNG